MFLQTLNRSSLSLYLLFTFEPHTNHSYDFKRMQQILSDMQFDLQRNAEALRQSDLQRKADNRAAEAALQTEVERNRREIERMEALIRAECAERQVGGLFSSCFLAVLQNLSCSSAFYHLTIALYNFSRHPLCLFLFLLFVFLGSLALSFLSVHDFLAMTHLLDFYLIHHAYILLTPPTRLPPIFSNAQAEDGAIIAVLRRQYDELKLECAELSTRLDRANEQIRTHYFEHKATEETLDAFAKATAAALATETVERLKEDEKLAASIAEANQVRLPSLFCGFRRMCEKYSYYIINL
jgi:hypothetical protein